MAISVVPFVNKLQPLRASLGVGHFGRCRCGAWGETASSRENDFGRLFARTKSSDWVDFLSVPGAVRLERDFVLTKECPQPRDFHS